MSRALHSLGKYLLPVVLAVMVGCASPLRVEVAERSTISVREQTEKIGGAVIRIIEPGDTLYSIAFGTGLNVNDLALWNDISDTSKLQIGQQIRLTKPLNFKSEPVPEPTLGPKTVAVAESQHRGDMTAKLVGKTPLQVNAVKVRAQRSKQQRPGKQRPGKPRFVPQWEWPLDGKVVSRFAVTQGQQGIDILGQLGQAVTATNAGEVVYVGNGLRGYGNLVIIKHNDTFLSAYAHNQKTYVREGQRVAMKQVIGSVGVDRKKRHTLHFQIRKNGNPVNPLAYLPSK